MIRLVAKCGLIIEFAMASDDKETILVKKFSLQAVDPNTKLKLGRFGSILVKDIYEMTIIKAKSDMSINLEDVIKWKT